MRHFKHYCKLIISTLVVVLVFACNSIVSYADPLTGAMIASQIASGFGFAGFASSPAETVSALTGDFYSDLVPWTDLVAAAHAYLTIRDLVSPANSVEIELSPEISEAGFERTNQFVSHYSLNPGSVVNLGSFFSYNGYAFNRTVNSSGNLYYYGPVIGSSPSSFSTPGTISFGSCYLSFVQNGGAQSFSATSTIGNAPSSSHVVSSLNSPFCLYYWSSIDAIGWKYGNSNTFLNAKTSSQSGINTVSRVSYDVSRSADSQVINPDNRSNVVVIPSSYVSNITYKSGETIVVENDVIATLDAIASAGANSDISSSSYGDPTPTGETISETAYSVLNDTFVEFKEFFGDIYDGITDFHESFGDWVDDVASGWTEVFGDIYSDLHGFKESFGDWVDDVASGWTEIFGDISSTLSGTIADTLSTISSGIQSIVQSIENADFEFIDAFWKNFLTPFNSLFNTIKSHLSIWHYVVEWLASISSVFTFYLGVFSGAGSGFLLPIYACFAGTVVIAVYKRFGK